MTVTMICALLTMVGCCCSISFHVNDDRPTWNALWCAAISGFLIYWSWT